MNPIKSLSLFACSMAMLIALSTSSAQANINLVFQPSPTVVSVGNSFSIGLYAFSDSASNQSMASIDAILMWDPSLIQLTGLSNAGNPYSWMMSDFPNDSGFDGLNAPFTPVPANDGNAYYRAFRNTGAPAMATPAGLLVTTLNFTALAPTASTLLTIPPSFGSFTNSYIIDGQTAGLDVTGTLGQAEIIIVPEPASLILVFGAVALVARRRKTRI